MTDKELIGELRARAEVEGAGSLGSLLNEAAERLEDLTDPWLDRIRMRPMDLADVTATPGTPVQLEIKKDGRMIPAEYLYDGDGRVNLRLRGKGYGAIILPVSGYGRNWRCWEWGQTVTRTDRRMAGWS